MNYLRSESGNEYTHKRGSMASPVSGGFGYKSTVRGQDEECSVGRIEIARGRMCCGPKWMMRGGRKKRGERKKVEVERKE